MFAGFTKNVLTCCIIFQPFRLHGIENGPENRAILTRDEALKYYRQMVAVRKMETEASNMYKSKEIRGFCHLYSGQVSHSVTFTLVR